MGNLGEDLLTGKWNSGVFAASVSCSSVLILEISWCRSQECHLNPTVNFLCPRSALWSLVLLFGLIGVLPWMA